MIQATFSRGYEKSRKHLQTVSPRVAPFARQIDYDGYPTRKTLSTLWSKSEASVRAILERLYKYLDYQVKIELFPNNEVAVRLQPRVLKSRDNCDDLERKSLALQLENALKNPDMEDIDARGDDGWKFHKDNLAGWGNLPSERTFNKRTKKKIVRGLSAIESKLGKENMRFLTVTLPGSTELSMYAIACYSAYIVNRLNTWLKRKIGDDDYYRVNVWEHQKRGALHLHLAIGSTNREGLEKVDREFQYWCYTLFQNLTEITGVDMFERKDGGTWKDDPNILRCRSEKVEKSVSCYMSKYMSKATSKQTEDSDKQAELYYPSRWATWTRNVTKVMHERTIELPRKRIEVDNAVELTFICRHIANNYAPEKYSEPLIYKDKIGGGVNIKMIIKPEEMDIVEEILSVSLDCCDHEKSSEINYNLPSREYVIDKELNEVYACYKALEMQAKYGSDDRRIWLEEFKNSRRFIPGYFHDEYGLPLYAHGASCPWNAPNMPVVQTNVFDYLSNTDNS